MFYLVDGKLVFIPHMNGAFQETLYFCSHSKYWSQIMFSQYQHIMTPQDYANLAYKQ